MDRVLVFLWRLVFNELVFYGVPLLSVLFLVVSLYRYLAARRRNETEPGSFSDAELRRRKTLFLAALVLALLLLTVMGGLIALFYMSIAYM